MKKFTRLGALASLAESKEKKAIKAMVEVQKNKMLVEQKLQQLVEFQDQYLEHSRNSEQAGVNGSRILENRIFMDKIAQAIQDQELRIRGVEGQIRIRSAEWKKSRHQRSGFEKLMWKEVADQVRIQEKRDQIEIDDRSGQKLDELNGTESA
ncbi:MAG: flagellar export protein FliJ [Methylococcales bacterium]